MDQETIFLTILGMAAVTYIPRFLPAWMLTNRSLPLMVEKWMRFVPPAVLAALVLPALVIKDARMDIGLGNIFLLAALPTWFVARKTRSLLWPVALGMGLVASWRYLT